MHVKLENIREIYGTINDVQLSAAEVYNAVEGCGYRINLEKCVVDYDSENDYLTFTCEEGTSVDRPYGKVFGYDGLGWSDDTPYAFGSPGWMFLVEEYGLQNAHKKAALFIDMASAVGCQQEKLTATISHDQINISCPDHDVFRALLSMKSGKTDPTVAAVLSTLYVNVKKNGYVSIGPDELVSLNDLLAASTGDDRLKLMAGKMAEATKSTIDLTKLAS